MDWLPAVAVAALVGGQALTVLAAVRRRAFAAVVNGGGSLAVALVAVALTLRTPVGPGFAAWVGVAALLHTYGMLGPYETVWWWDHLTHAVSGGLVAALVYAAAVVSLDARVGAVTVGLTLALGVLWEVIELLARVVGRWFDLEPVLVHYGWDDTAVDLVVDAAAALAVVALDVRLLVPLLAGEPDLSHAALVATAAVAVGGTVVLGAGLWAADEVPPLGG